MSSQQRIVRERRQYNQWVASQTLEDYALRFTASSARKSAFRVGNTAIGPIAFLACEAIGGSLTVAYGFPNTLWAIVLFMVLMFLIGLPIAYYAAKYGVDLDLLTRGAGFGYLGSTVTSLIYASFTFLLFSVEATILSVALEYLLGIPIAVAHVLSTLVVIPIAIYGISAISRIQIATQPIWIALQFVPVLYIAWKRPADYAAWTHYAGTGGASGTAVNPLMLGMAASTLLSLLPQIGEQVDYLRFLPVRNGPGLDGPGRDRPVSEGPGQARHARNARRSFSWWTALLTTGPGWVLIGGFKLLAGSFLAVFALRVGVPLLEAHEPVRMYVVAFRAAFGSPSVALVLTGLFVIVCQIKINVTNAYAGSIAWSNFFSRLTHSHPGRVVWLVFNAVLALVLIEIGIVDAIEGILRIYANFAAGWIGALTADLVVNKPLRLSPRYIEFRRAYLYDINPVGVGALVLSVVTSSLAYLGLFGNAAQILSPFVALSTAFLAAPLIAWATGGRYYLARPADVCGPDIESLRCCICENVFEASDMAKCPVYTGPICSLCCTLESRCHDACKPRGRVAHQLKDLLTKILPAGVARALNSRAGNFVGIVILCNLGIGLLLAIIYREHAGGTAAEETVKGTLWLVYFSLVIPSCVVSWLIVLAHESRRTAEAESARQTSMLIEEIDAHRRTDADLQRAKEVAEAANRAKTRYIVGISHEIRTPLNSIFGYAQLLERDSAGAPDTAVRVIRRSAEHLSNLIDGLLDVSKIENGQLNLSRDTLKLGDFLDQLVDMFRLQALAKGLEFCYHPPARLPSYVHADTKRLRQILINLLSNAIKYTEQGSITLRVRYRSDIAEFEIADTGTGIAANDLARIFEPFERGSSEGVRATPGMGLGLTITKLLTHMMGGEVQVRSNDPAGTVFVVRLFLSEVRNEIPALGPARRIVEYRGSRQEILVADDDPQHLELLRNFLRPIGFNMLLARDGKTCLELAAQSRPHLTIVDLSLPDMSGWDLARELRATPDLARMKIMIVSANAHEYSPGAGLLHDAFVIKPVELEALLERVGTLLNLDWIYHENSGRDPAEVAPKSRLNSRSQHHLDDLYRLGRIGHVRGIEAKLREFELEDPVNEAFATELRTLIGNFDLKRYMHVLETLRVG
jgi:signal transduction histidine kinase/CheY-like chemotaxis protein/purine-cytosine permease-like protein